MTEQTIPSLFNGSEEDSMLVSKYHKNKMTKNYSNIDNAIAQISCSELDRRRVGGQQRYWRSKTMRIALIVATFFLGQFLGVLAVQAQSYYYVRAGATGTKNGSDWNNAYTSLPTALVRGATYYIADGNYSSHTFNDSGTSVITIKKATTSDHGTSTGWQSSFGDGQAVFSGQNNFYQGYYTFDGVTGGGPGSWESGHGIKLSTTNGKIIYPQANVSNLVFRHVEFAGVISDESGTNADFIYVVYGGLSNLTISYCYFHDSERTFILSWPNPMNTVLIEYTKFRRNGTGEHREAWSFSSDDNVTIRYCQFEDIFGTGVLAAVNGGGDASNWNIYGNVFWHSGGAAGRINSGGILTSYNCGSFSVSATNWKIYNNSFVNLNLGGYPAIMFSWCTGGGVSNVTAYNNIFYNLNGGGISSVTTEGYNWYYGVSNNGGTGDQTGTGDPFVNINGEDFRLSGSNLPNIGYDTGALIAGNNVDAYGTMRGAGGIWDRGAYEYGSAVSVNPPPVVPPKNLHVVGSAN